MAHDLNIGLKDKKETIKAKAFLFSFSNYAP